MLKLEILFHHLQLNCSGSGRGSSVCGLILTSLYMLCSGLALVVFSSVIGRVYQMFVSNSTSLNSYTCTVHHTAKLDYLWGKSV